MSPARKDFIDEEYDSIIEPLLVFAFANVESIEIHLSKGIQKSASGEVEDDPYLLRLGLRFRKFGILPTMISRETIRMVAKT